MKAVKLVSVSLDAENIIAYCARVSSPHQDNPQIAGLLRYMIREGHWSPFEMANMVVEITTSRAISSQILRHRSFTFQEFSQRYAQPDRIIYYDARRQDEKNRQNSIDNMSTEDRIWFDKAQFQVANLGFDLYGEAISKGIAKETARFLLPLNTQTRLYMNGTLRSWIHYIDLRGNPEHGAQKEHQDIVKEIKEIFKKEFPVISEALGWLEKSIL